MRITDVQRRPDGGYYATVNGKELEFTGNELQADSGICDKCGEWREFVYGDVDARIVICSECFKQAAEQLKWR